MTDKDITLGAAIQKLDTLREDVQGISARVETIDAYISEQKLAARVRNAVKVRCAIVWSGFLGFIALVGGFVTNNFDILKEAGKAALKVVIGRL